MSFKLCLRTAFVLAALALPVPAGAMTLAAGSATPAVRVEGRVLSATPDPASRTTLIVLGDSDGREVARFTTLGARVGRVQWVADGFPTLAPGDEVAVGLTTSGALAFDGAGEPAVRRLTPARSSLAAGIVPAVTEIDPPQGGAVPEDGAIVTVHGSGFGATQGESNVSFLGIFQRVDAQVISWADDAIVCRVPAPGLLGTPQVLSGPVKVWTPDGGWSDGDPFVNGGSFSVLYQWAGDFWPTARLPIRVWVNDATAPPALDLFGSSGSAAGRWNVPGSYARFTLMGRTTAEGGNHGDPGTPRDGRNTVIWRSTWAYDPTILALTWSSIDTLTLEREEVELEINGTRPWTLDPDAEPTKFDLPSTLVHEFGHWLRLGHTQRVPSVMLGFQSAGEKRRDVSTGDANGASWIHPAYGILQVPIPATSGTVIASGGGLDFPFIAFDREGKLRAGLAAELVDVKAIPIAWGAWPNELDPPLAIAPTAEVHAVAATDDAGRTAVHFDALPDGVYRLEASTDGHFVRPAPLILVGPAPRTAYALAFTGVPSPLLPGVHGRVRFTLPAEAFVRLELFDARGRRVREVARGAYEAGPHEAPLETTGGDGARLRAGVYYLRLATLAGSATSRVVVLP